MDQQSVTWGPVFDKHSQLRMRQESATDRGPLYRYAGQRTGIDRDQPTPFSAMTEAREIDTLKSSQRAAPHT